MSPLPRGRSLANPDPAPFKRWSRRRICALIEPLAAYPDDWPLDIAVDNAGERLQFDGARNTVYGPAAKLPADVFAEVCPELLISKPELMFVEMANIMPLAQLVMLGHELCGGFSRDPVCPRDADVTFDTPPVTSVARIARLLDDIGRFKGVGKARKALRLVEDNAWSPMESIVTAMAALPITASGYGLVPYVLNKRISTPLELRDAAYSSSRVPDALFCETNVGINYEGAPHLNLGDVIGAAMDMQGDSPSAFEQTRLNRAVREVRMKAVDDIRRNRELAVDGYTVFQVTKEDLYEPGGLDRVMLQVACALERATNRPMSELKRTLADRDAAQRRQALLWSLLPRPQNHAHSQDEPSMAGKK